MCTSSCAVRIKWENSHKMFRSLPVYNKCPVKVNCYYFISFNCITSTHPNFASQHSCWCFHSILHTSRLRFRAPKSCLMERLAFSTRLPNTCSIFWPSFNDTISAAPSQAPFWRNWCLYLLIPPADIYWRPTVRQVWSLREFPAPSSSEGWAPWEEIPEWEKIAPNGFLILWCHALSLLVIKCLSPPWHTFFMPQSIIILQRSLFWQHKHLLPEWNFR